jgi:hypothetical protein
MLILYLCLVAIAPFLGVLAFSAWNPGPGYFVVGVAVVGIYMTFLDDPPPSKREKRLWLVITCALATMEIIAIRRTSNESTQVRREQIAAFEKMMVNEDATRSTVTGDGSWPMIGLNEVELADRPPIRTIPYIMIFGQYPLRHVQLRVVDYIYWRESYMASSKVTVADYLSGPAAKVTNLGDVRAIQPYAKALWEPIGIDVDQENEKHYFIEIQAMNGFWREYLQYKKVKGKWVHAIKVNSLDSNGYPKKENPWTDISDGFGAVDWDN